MDTQELQRIKNRFDIIGNDPGLNKALETAVAVAPTDLTVLITGESGVGKENIAKIIHQYSRRRNGKYFAINCGGLPEGTINSELFGHEKGSFTGANETRRGYFEEANGGTIFLDEVGELPMSTQVMLLRVLQNGEFIKVGSSKVEKTDVRIVAATNRNLEEEVLAGRFREDLFYRLNVITLILPPLCERGDDVILIARSLIRRYAKEFNMVAKNLSQEAIMAIRKYKWPGNVRQLENRIKKALILSDKPQIQPADLDLMPEVLKPIMTLAEAKDDFQKRYINEVLELNNGNRSKTAQDLGVDPRTIFRHLAKQNEK